MREGSLPNAYGARLCEEASASRRRTMSGISLRKTKSNEPRSLADQTRWQRSGYPYTGILAQEMEYSKARTKGIVSYQSTAQFQRCQNVSMGLTKAKRLTGVQSFGLLVKRISLIASGRVPFLEESDS